MHKHIAQVVSHTGISIELIHRAQQRDAAAFEEIYRLTCRRVYTQCLHLMRNAAEAEDLTQEVFLQLYRKIDTYRGESAFLTWMHRVTLNAALMRFRRKAVPLTAMDDMDNNGLLVHPEDRPELGREDGYLTHSADRLALQAAIARLAPGYRVIVYLHDVFGYEHREIAEILACSIGNSKSQLHKARLKIREQLMAWQAGEQRSRDRHLDEVVFRRKSTGPPGETRRHPRSKAVQANSTRRPQPRQSEWRADRGSPVRSGVGQLGRDPIGARISPRLNCQTLRQWASTRVLP